MVKRYYCDYCDKSFPYSVEARKKHVNGYQHQKLRTLHFNKFKSAQEKLYEESKKEKCRRFLSGQECAFGDACIYSHLNDTDIDRLREEVRLEKSWKHRRFHSRNENDKPSVDKWMSEKYKGGKHIKYGVLDESSWEMKFKTQHDALEQASLPPSLLPPTVDTILDCEFQDWG